VNVRSLNDGGLLLEFSILIRRMWIRVRLRFDPIPSRFFLGVCRPADDRYPPSRTHVSGN